MAKTTFDYQEDRSTPNDTSINSPFVNLQQNTNGVVGRIDGDNLRTEAINTNHLDNGAKINDIARGFTSAEITINTTSWTTIGSVLKTMTLQQGTMVRLEANPITTAVQMDNANNPTNRGHSQYYLQWYYVSGGQEFPLSPVWGYGAITDGRGYTGNRPSSTTWYNRMHNTFIWIPTAGSIAVTEFRLKCRNDDANGAGSTITVKWADRLALAIQPLF